MTRFVLIILLCAGASFQALSADFKFNGRTISVPEGFEVDLVAGPPLVERPIEADFDEQGRLYVSDSSGSNEKPDKQLLEKPHRIVRLEDTDGDGKFDKATVFADKMMFPEGVMWREGSLYVGAPPSIWKLTDTTGSGVADKREEWMQGKTLTGCANDLHGPYAGPDGWIYWCKGAFAKQTYERPGKEPFVTRAAHIFRCRPDGTGIEPVMTGGMDNPVEVVFTATGERIFSTTFLQDPGGGKRDGLIHAVYGGVYGKVHDVIDEHPRTGDILPVLTHLGPAAPCGLARYESDVFGAEYRDNLFTCCFNLRKVIRHVLIPDGATYKTRDMDFMTSDDPDFHPTDVLEDADGSLIVLNTGGWYKLCCPTSQLAKPDVLGQIYRIRRKGAPKIMDPRGSKIDWVNLKPGDLVRLLEDPRPAVRKRAIEQLAKRGKDALPALADDLQKSNSPEGRRNAIWALTRIDSTDARAAVPQALADRDNTVRHVAAHSVSLWRDPGAVEAMETLLHDDDAQVRRSAAEALGRIGNYTAVPALLKATAELKGNDRMLEHSLIYALIEIADREKTAQALRSENSHTRRAALIALDQMRDGRLSASEVTPLLVSNDAVLKETARWIVSRHNDWGGALAGFFRERLKSPDLGAVESTELQSQLARLASDQAIQEIMAGVLADKSSVNQTRLIALRAMAEANLKSLPAIWNQPLVETLRSSDNELLRAGIAAARALTQAKAGTPEMAEILRQIGKDANSTPETRLEALAAAPPLEQLSPDLFNFLLGNVDASKPWTVRNNAATVLGRARLDREQLLALADTLRSVGAIELGKLLSAFETCADETVGTRLVENLKSAKAASSLRAETLKPKIVKFPEVVRKKADDLLASLDEDAAKQKQHLDELLAELRGGDIRRGQALFNSPKAACATCHAMGYLGGHVGPDLTSVGTIRTERDLLESIVYPSASFVRSYEPMIVLTKGGEQYNGILRKDAADEVVLVTGPEAEARIARPEIAEMRPGSVSLMPAGLDQQLSKQDLADLVAFLKNTKWGPQ
jgi:putative membrane-bound dehydrogenase-like protein